MRSTASISGSSGARPRQKRPPFVDRYSRFRAVAIADDDPDYVVYAARNRLYLSTNGGLFWRGLAPELPEIEAVLLTP